MSSFRSEEATRRVRRPLNRLAESTLPVFDPAQDRTLAGLARFLFGCKLEPARPTGIVPSLPRNITGAHMVRLGEESRYLLELLVIRDANHRCFGLYLPPPPDLRTLLPELGVVDLARSRALLEHKDGRRIMLNSLSVDEVTHIIVLAQGPDEEEDSLEELEGLDVDIVFEEE